MGDIFGIDDEAERKLLEGTQACTWRKRPVELFRDVVILMRDTGMRNQRELYRMRIENVDWQNSVLEQASLYPQRRRRRVTDRLPPMQGCFFAPEPLTRVFV